MPQYPYSLIVTQSVTVVRDGKRVSPEINKVFAFSEAECRQITGANPQGLRKPINEVPEINMTDFDDTADIDDDGGSDTDDSKDTEAPAKKPAPAKKARGRSSANKPASEDTDI